VRWGLVDGGEDSGDLSSRSPGYWSFITVIIIESSCDEVQRRAWRHYTIHQVSMRTVPLDPEVSPRSVLLAS